jgi:hypothetical protein
LPIQYLKGAPLDENGNPLLNVSAPAPNDDIESSYVNILAAFQMDEKPRLIDAVDVRKPEQVVSVDIFAPLLVKTDHDGYLIHSRQRGLGDDFSSYSLFTLENGRMKLLVDTFPPLFTRSRCDSDLDDIATFWDTASGRSKYRKIWMRLTRTEKIHSADCKRIVRTTVKTQRYSACWDENMQEYNLSVEPSRPRKRVRKK